MAKWLLAVLLAVPLVDAIFLVVVADSIGWPATVLLVVLTALLGTLLVRAEGRRTIRKLQRSLLEGESPTDSLIDGGLLIAAGALLLTPGLVTDVIGLLMVIPLSRIPIRAALKKYVIVPKLDEQTGGFATGNVYTFGFPNREQSGSVDPSDFDIDSETTDAAASADDGTVDLGADEYDVEGDEVEFEDRDPDN